MTGDLDDRRPHLNKVTHRREQVREKWTTVQAGRAAEAVALRPAPPSSTVDSTEGSDT